MRRNDIPRPVRWLKAVVTLATALIIAHWITSGADDIVSPVAPPAQVERVADPLPPRIADIIADGARCWSGSDSPLAPLPSAAVVRIERTGRVIHTTDPVLLDLAFSEALGTDSPRVALLALCIR